MPEYVTSEIRVRTNDSMGLPERFLAFNGIPIASAIVDPSARTALLAWPMLLGNIAIAQNARSVGHQVFVLGDGQVLPRGEFLPLTGPVDGSESRDVDDDDPLLVKEVMRPYDPTLTYDRIADQETLLLGPLRAALAYLAGGNSLLAGGDDETVAIRIVAGGNDEVVSVPGRVDEHWIAEKLRYERRRKAGVLRLLFLQRWDRAVEISIHDRRPVRCVVPLRGSYSEEVLDLILKTHANRHDRSLLMKNIVRDGLLHLVEPLRDHAVNEKETR